MALGLIGSAIGMALNIGWRWYAPLPRNHSHPRPLSNLTRRCPEFARPQFVESC